MRANLDATRGLIFADAAAGILSAAMGREKAHRVVAEAAERVRTEPVDLVAAIAADTSLPSAARRSVAAAVDLAPATAAAAAATDRILAAHRPLLHQKAAK
jgi:3-carboxy-cis,cis-muconate cycloisomerase